MMAAARVDIGLMTDDVVQTKAKHLQMFSFGLHDVDLHRVDLGLDRCPNWHCCHSKYNS